jgi:hypothetical protein
MAATIEIGSKAIMIHALCLNLLNVPSSVISSSPFLPIHPNPTQNDKQQKGNGGISSMTKVTNGRKTRRSHRP